MLVRYQLDFAPNECPINFFDNQGPSGKSRPQKLIETRKRNKYPLAEDYIFEFASNGMSLIARIEKRNPEA